MVGMVEAAQAQQSLGLRGSIYAEVGVRTWISTGNTTWAHDASSVNPAFGNPTSKLDYQDLTAYTTEIYGRMEVDGYFLKGVVGTGFLKDGTLDDEDYFTGQVKFSDTRSDVDDGRLSYAMVDGGVDFGLPGVFNRVVVGAFVGGAFWKEKTPAFGASCNADDVGGFFCGPVGSNAIPIGDYAITNNMEWYAIRVGAEARVDVTDRLTIAGEFAVLPYASLRNEDSHHQRADLGPVPNIFHKGEGYGFQAEALADFRIAKNFSIGAGVRYWYAEVDSAEIFFGQGSNTPLPVTLFKAERYGVFAQLTYIY